MTASLPQRRVGRDGPLVPVLGFGAWPIGGGMGAVERRAAIGTVRAAIDAGITLLDTAQGYRESEVLIGEALRDGYRERCILATKVSGDYSPVAIEKALEHSLRALRVDCIDLYQIHSWRDDPPVEESLAADDERSKFRRFQGEEFAAHLKLAAELTRVAQEKGLTLVQLALAWILRRTEVSCVLVGARSPQQVAEQAAAAGVGFTPGELARIDALLAAHPWTPER